MSGDATIYVWVGPTLGQHSVLDVKLGDIILLADTMHVIIGFKQQESTYENLAATIVETIQTMKNFRLHSLTFFNSNFFVLSKCQ